MVDCWRRKRLKPAGGWAVVGSCTRCLFLTSATVQTRFHLPPSSASVGRSEAAAAAAIQKGWRDVRLRGDAGSTCRGVSRCGGRGLHEHCLILPDGRRCLTTDLQRSDVGEHREPLGRHERTGDGTRIAMFSYVECERCVPTHVTTNTLPSNTRGRVWQSIVFCASQSQRVGAS